MVYYTGQRGVKKDKFAAIINEGKGLASKMKAERMGANYCELTPVEGEHGMAYKLKFFADPYVGKNIQEDLLDKAYASNVISYDNFGYTWNWKKPDVIEEAFDGKLKLGIRKFD